MGLFGGFKAKFTKDSAAKSTSKSSKKNVVCVAYRVFSEFDEPHQYLEQTVPDRTTPSRIKTSLPEPDSSKNNNNIRPGASTTVETNISTNPHVKKPLKQKPNTPVDETNAPQSNKAEIAQMRTGSPQQNPRSAPNSYVLGKTSTFNPASDWAQKIESPTASHRSDSQRQETESKSLVQASEYSSDEYNNYERPLTMASTKFSYDYQGEPADYSESVSTTHVVTTSSNSFYDEEYSYSTRNIGATSNFASNIFCEDDDQPQVVHRPRRTNLNGNHNNESFEI